MKYFIGLKQSVETRYCNDVNANRFLAIQIIYKGQEFTLNLLFEDLPKLFNKSQLADLNLNKLKHYLNYLLRKLLGSGHASILGIHIGSNDTFAYEVKIFNDETNLQVSFFAKDKLLEVEEMLLRIHQQFMLDHSLVCNQKMDFPILLGESVLTYQDIKSLKVGSLLLLDKFYASRRKVICRVGKLNIDLKIQHVS